MAVCKCCPNWIGVNGPDLVAKSNQALCEVPGKPFAKVAIGRVEMRVTLDDESAEKMVRELLESFPNIGRNIAAHILVKGY